MRIHEKIKYLIIVIKFVIRLNILYFRKEQSIVSNFRSSLTIKLPYLDLKTYVIDLSKGNCNRIKNSKDNVF